MADLEANQPGVADETLTEDVATEESQTDDASTSETVEETDEQRNARIAAEQAEKNRQRAERRQQTINQRMSELTARARAAEEQNATLATMLREAITRVGGPAPSKGDENAEPQRDAYESYEDYIVARATWKAQQDMARVMEHQTRQQHEEMQRRTAAESEAAAVRAFTERVQKFRTATPDYDEVMSGDEVIVPNSVARMIRDSEDGPMLAYHLQKNPDMAATLHRMNPLQQAMSLGAISATLKASSTSNAATNAPAPGKPAGAVSRSIGDANTPPDDYEAYVRWRAKHFKE